MKKISLWIGIIAGSTLIGCGGASSPIALGGASGLAGTYTNLLTRATTSQVRLTVAPSGAVSATVMDVNHPKSGFAGAGTIDADGNLNMEAKDVNSTTPLAITGKFSAGTFTGSFTGGLSIADVTASKLTAAVNSQNGTVGLKGKFEGSADDHEASGTEGSETVHVEFGDLHSLVLTGTTNAGLQFNLTGTVDELYNVTLSGTYTPAGGTPVAVKATGSFVPSADGSTLSGILTLADAASTKVTVTIGFVIPKL